MFSLLSLLMVASAAAVPTARQVASTSVVTLSNNTGTPSHLASGVLYGIPDAPDQIPDHFYTDMGFNYARAGGAQTAAPGRGWIWGLDEYKVRFASALSNYQTTLQHNGNFIFLIHDLWGADGTQNATAPYPGDNGDWSSWDDYLTQWISDMNANDATVGLSIDIWNEPDLSFFWNRSQDQYLEMWGRTYPRLRAEWPDVLLIGPAAAEEPLNSSWWDNFMAFVASNGTVPDQWVWHMEGGGGDMLSAQGGLYALLAQYDLPIKPLNIDEYATYPEQVPSGSAWWISQLERVNAVGLRGNWLSGTQLHDFLASLLSKTDPSDSTGTGYFPNGDYQVYKYYNLNMTGNRVGTSPSADLFLDTYATVGTDLVRVLAGVRVQTGTWQVTIDDLSSVGLPEDGTLEVHTWGFPFTGSHFGEVDAPTDLGSAAFDYSGNSVTFPVVQTDNSTAYAFEFAVGS